MEIILFFQDNNYENCCIGFTKNGSDIEVAFDDLDINQSYAMAVAGDRLAITIQILE